jgi:hypothetical protein
MLTKAFDFLRVRRKLLFGKGAQLVATSASGAETVIDMAELAAINNISATEAGYIDGAVAGTGAASKALVLSSGGDVTMPAGGIFAMSRAALAAAGSGQSDAAAITEQITLVTGADNAVGVALPAAAATEGPYLIVNTVANKSLLVYPVNAGNDAINGLTAGTGAFTLGPGRSAWFVPTSGTQWYTEEISGAKAKTITATYAVTVAENNMTYYINNATGFVTTLPAPFLGARYTFINMTANTSGNHTIVSNASANIIKGNQNSVAGDAGDTGTADDTINFVANNSLAGDKVELFSDGTSWFAYAISRVAAGMTFTQAS